MKVRTKAPQETVAPAPVEEVVDRYAVDPAQWQTGAVLDRYAAIGGNRYAAEQILDRYSAGQPVDAHALVTAIMDDQEAILNRYEVTLHPEDRLIRQTILIPPRPRPPVRRMIWLPSMEYEGAFEWEFGPWAVWTLGDTVDFTAAVESATTPYELEHDGPNWCWGTPIEHISDTYENGETPIESYDSDLWPDVMRLAKVLRNELAGDLDQLIEPMENDWLDTIGWWAGTKDTPQRADVKLAAGADKIDGLGAAALDFAVWRQPEMYGRAGVELQQGIEAITEDEFVRLAPREGLVLDVEDLHRGTIQDRPSSWNRLMWRLIGEYAVHTVDYHSDMNFEIVAGWRVCYLTPFGVPIEPDFT